MTMAQDESVDGSKVAAQILAQMKGTGKNRIIDALRRKNPALTKEIENKMFNFDELITISDQGIQKLIKETDHDTLVLSLKTASTSVQNLLFKNMSERKRMMVREDFASLPPKRVSEVQEAQRSILERLDELRLTGGALSQDTKDIWV